MNTIECKNVSKNFKEKEALRSINLTLEPNKIYGLIGRNGAGKTTLLSLISGQSSSSSGEITLGNAPIWENQAALNQICFSREISQTSSVANYKIKELFRIAKIYYPNWDSAMAKELLERFELEDKTRISKLSKGMMSMVTIIIALASKCEYTFLDEPVAGLDIVSRKHFYHLLLKEYQESKRTFIISTHIIEEAADVFEEVIILKKGECLLKENADSLCSRAYQISGKTDVIDQLTSSYKIHSTTLSGRSKSVTVLLEECQSIEPLKLREELNVIPLNLQDLFVALCEY